MMVACDDYFNDVSVTQPLSVDEFPGYERYYIAKVGRLFNLQILHKSFKDIYHCNIS